MYRDFDGWMVPLPKCSLTNLHSSTNSACDRGISFPGNDAGAPGLSSIVWSQIRDGGNLWDASPLNTLEYWWYCLGIFSSSEGVVWLMGSITILPMKYRSVCQVAGQLICHGMNRAFAALGALKMIGNWE